MSSNETYFSRTTKNIIQSFQTLSTKHQTLSIKKNLIQRGEWPSSTRGMTLFNEGNDHWVCNMHAFNNGGENENNRSDWLKLPDFQYILFL